MKNRQELAEHFKKLGFTRGAEIGVFDGHYSEVLCQTISPLKLFAIDCWQVYKGYRDHAFQKSMDRAYEKAVRRLMPYNCTMIKAFSIEALKFFDDNSLDFVFIDGNHAYEHVNQDIREWSKKVRPGGIVAGHDYYVTKTGNVGVIKAVDDYVKEHGYKLEVTEWDKDNPIEDDRQPCWWFVK